MAGEAIDGLEALLEEECDALRAGDFARLARLAPAKLRALETLADEPPQATARLAGMARRNARLLQAANAGLSAGLARLREMRSAVEGKTYGPDGRRQSLSRPGTTRRA